MKDWRKDRNYRKHKNADGTFAYTITVDGESVKVSEEIFTAYASSARQLEYIENDLKRNRVQQDADGKAVRDTDGKPILLPEREVSLDKLIDEDWDFTSSGPLPEDAFLERFWIEALHKGISLLDDDERELIEALFFKHMTIRAYAKQTGMSKSRVERYQQKIIAKLRNFLIS